MRELHTLVNLDAERLRIFENLVRRDEMAARLWLFLESEDIKDGEERSYPLFADDPAAYELQVVKREAAHD
jgi:hypothetical protein